MPGRSTDPLSTLINWISVSLPSLFEDEFDEWAEQFAGRAVYLDIGLVGDLRAGTGWADRDCVGAGVT
jgi:hypothetical protein